MNKTLNPRLSEPIAAALMGVGFFMFAAALAGGPWWSGAEQALWRHFQGLAAPAEAPPMVLIQGRGRENLSLGERRLALARDIQLLGASGAKAIVLEAWLGEPSQAEGQALLSQLLASSKSLPKKSAKTLAATVESLRKGLNADSSLALAMLAAGKVLLPVEALPTPSQTQPSDLTWDKAHAYEVTVRGKGVMRLDGDWSLGRAPMEAFSKACLHLGLLPLVPEAAQNFPQEIPGVFQVGGHWVNGMGLQAAMLALDVPFKGLRFQWVAGRPAFMELKGVHYPFTSRGGFWLPARPERAEAPTLVLDSLEGSPVLAGLRGKLVFYQPWPGLLSEEASFDRQREICAGLLAGQILEAPRSGSGLPAQLGLWLACTLGILFLPSALSWLLPLGLGSWECWRFIAQQAPLAENLGFLVAACLCGAGLRMHLAKRRGEARSMRLRGALAPGSQKRWEGLLPDLDGKNWVEGVYLLLKPGGPGSDGSWAAWAAQVDAFCESLDTGDLGFLIPCHPSEPYPLDEIQGLRRLSPSSALSAARGRFELSARKVFDSVQWDLSGPPKEECVAMLAMARPGSFMVVESDYSQVRHRVKIQIVAEIPLVPGGPGKKIFNIIEVI
jgi:hypothetical protein